MIDSFNDKHRFLSNFSVSHVKLGGITYPTVEHAYQAAKTLDKTERLRIQRAAGPGRAKRLGRGVTLRPDWEGTKLRIMLNLLRQKFQFPKLRDLLLATENQELIEGNHWGDTFWGVCQGEGENHLGKLLMQVRDELRR
ncbi:hypothetical protein LCGC14_0232290 [marine sediment metagenome]|uniref:NADAR domain-containing protein n=1 Tax=marine sediment metagenome TaxID=412755 RepID=A0A0F9XEB5_9ZZZZ